MTTDPDVSARGRAASPATDCPLVLTEADEVHIIYTSRVRASDLDDDAIALCCHLFQEWVPKAFDVRLTVVGDWFFAVAGHAEIPPLVGVWTEGAGGRDRSGAA